MLFKNLKDFFFGPHRIEITINVPTIHIAVEQSQVRNNKQTSVPSFGPRDTGEQGQSDFPTSAEEPDISPSKFTDTKPAIGKFGQITSDQAPKEDLHE
jgi:hypothetical protein